MYNPAPSRPALFRRPRLLIVGCGDVGLRLAALMQPYFRMRALTSSPHRVAELRQAGITPLSGDLDRASTLSRLAGLATWVAHLAPPPGAGRGDPRTARLLQALARRPAVLRLVYASTSGVYGDAQGAWVDETAALRAHTPRARRRVDAERRVRGATRTAGWRAAILRIPGIYAWDREGGDPRDRLRRGMPVLHEPHDVYTNHIHADDLARACRAALFRAAGARTYNVCDDVAMKTGEYYDHVAELTGLPRPERISPEAAQTRLSDMQRSFLQESRRLRNGRMKRELRLRLRYPSVDAAWAALQDHPP